MVKVAQGLADDMISIRDPKTTKVGWTVEKLIGAPGQWEIVYHDRMADLGMVSSHGHG